MRCSGTTVTFTWSSQLRFIIPALILRICLCIISITNSFLLVVRNFLVWKFGLLIVQRIVVSYAVFAFIFCWPFHEFISRSRDIKFVTLLNVSRIINIRRKLENYYGMDTDSCIFFFWILIVWVHCLFGPVSFRNVLYFCICCLLCSYVRIANETGSCGPVLLACLWSWFSL